MSTKRYFWLKLKDDFFHEPKIKKLRRMAGGDTYTIILQKIMLLSIKDGGVIEYQKIEKSLHEELALILDEDVINVEAALSFMHAAGFIESLKDDQFLLPFVPHLIGSETDSAERVRRFREKHKSESLPALQSNGSVMLCNENVTTDIEPEEELEKEEGGNAHMFEHLSLEQIADLHSVTAHILEEFLEYRMNSGGINTPTAFRKTLFRDLSSKQSLESESFKTWMHAIAFERPLIDHLLTEFLSIPSHIFSRKECRLRAKDDIWLKRQNIVPSDIAVEIAYQYAESKHRKQIGGAA